MNVMKMLSREASADEPLECVISSRGPNSMTVQEKYHDAMQKVRCRSEFPMSAPPAVFLSGRFTSHKIAENIAGPTYASWLLSRAENLWPRLYELK